MPDLSLETLHGGGVAGVDEAGRGPWAGPVVAASVVLGSSMVLDGINDSKKMSSKQRSAVYDQIMKHCQVGIGISGVAVIDQVNILEATKQAMCQAIDNLPQLPDTALIDGNQLPELPCQAKAIIKGDSKSLSIAAASIIAKVTRDRIMQELHKEYPYYGWERNAGYGTKEHQEGLRCYGITMHHRRSFRPIKALMEA